MGKEACSSVGEPNEEAKDGEGEEGAYRGFLG